MTRCGIRTTDRVVLCLDAEGRFAPTDELLLLARVPRATALEVGSIRARDAVIAALATTELPLPVAPVVTAFADCTVDCADRVVLESAE